MITIKRALAVAAASAFALVALAGEPGSRNDGRRSIRLTESAVLLGTSVPPGSYVLRWTRERGSEEVHLELTRGRKVVASGEGLWIESEQRSPYHALVYKLQGNGRNELSEVRFENSTDAIQVGLGASSDSTQRAAKAEAD